MSKQEKEPSTKLVMVIMAKKSICFNLMAPCVGYMFLYNNCVQHTVFKM